MSVIHSSCVALGCRSRVSDGTARNSTLRSMTTSMQGSARAATPIHSLRPARGTAATLESLVGSIRVSSVAGMTPGTLPRRALSRQGTMSANARDRCHQSLAAAQKAGIVSAVTERIPRLAGRAVLLLSALLAVVEVGRVGLAGDTTKTLVAVAAAALFMP